MEQLHEYVIFNKISNNYYLELKFAPQFVTIIRYLFNFKVNKYLKYF